MKMIFILKIMKKTTASTLRRLRGGGFRAMLWGKEVKNMNHYITGGTIRQLREKQNLTQLQLAQRLCVSDKTVSKWETGRGLPDISLLEPLASQLRVSLPELLSGEQIENRNRSANLRRSRLYVCPLCGNVIHSMGSVPVCCCGITLPPLEPEAPEEDHGVTCRQFEDDFYITSAHPMTKSHYISFAAYVTDNRFELVKLYPEGDMQAHFRNRGRGMLLWYCNHHGLFSQIIGGK